MRCIQDLYSLKRKLWNILAFLNFSNFGKHFEPILKFALSKKSENFGKWNIFENSSQDTEFYFDDLWLHKTWHFMDSGAAILLWCAVGGLQETYHQKIKICHLTLVDTRLCFIGTQNNNYAHIAIS